jgi:hypothetical protein
MILHATIPDGLAIFLLHDKVDFSVGVPKIVTVESLLKVTPVDSTPRKFTGEDTSAGAMKVKRNSDPSGLP